MKPLLVATAALLALTAGCASDDSEPSAATGTSETPAPSVDPAAMPPASLDAVRADVETVAVSLESFYRGTPYPQSADEVVATLADAGLALSPGNTIGGYRYDADAVEFTLCVENESGGFATYDTAPMTLREYGETGGCPFS